MFDLHRFTLFLLILFVALGIQIRSLEILGWGIDAVLVVLLVCAVWATLTEELLLIMIAVLFLNWRPGIPFEMVILMLAPILLFFTRTAFPWRRGITVGLFLILSLVALYGAHLGRAVIYQGFFWNDMIASLALGGALFLFFKARYQAFKTAGRSTFYALPR